MADYSQFLPKIDEKTKYELGARFDQLWISSGQKPPKTQSEMLAFTKAKDDYISLAVKEAVSGKKSSPMLNGVLNAEKPFAPVYNDAMAAENARLMTHDAFKPPQGFESFNLFQSTPIAPPQAPAAAPATPMPPIPVAVGAGGRGSVGFSGGGGVGGNPNVDKMYGPVIDLLRKGSGIQEKAAQEGFAGLQAATDAYTQGVGVPPELLDFVRAERAKNIRPERDKMELRDDDKGRMLADFGLGVLARNREGAGAAIGKSGKEALAIGDKALAEMYSDALAKYNEKMAEINADATLTATDYANKTNAEQRKFDKATGLATGQEKMRTAGVPGITAEATAKQNAIKEALAFALQDKKERGDNYRAKVAADAYVQRGANKEQDYTPAQILAMAKNTAAMAEKTADPAAKAELIDKAQKLQIMYARALQQQVGGR
jgi:hypothetical protein